MILESALVVNFYYHMLFFLSIHMGTAPGELLYFAGFFCFLFCCTCLPTAGSIIHMATPGTVQAHAPSQPPRRLSACVLDSHGVYAATTALLLLYSHLQGVKSLDVTQRQWALCTKHLPVGGARRRTRSSTSQCPSTASRARLE